MKIHIKSKQDYFQLFSVLKKSIKNEKFDLIIDVTFLEPFDILILTQFVIVQKNRGCVFKVKSKNHIINYLKDIGFVQFCNENHIEPKTIEGIGSYTAMPIRRVERNTMAQYIDLTVRYFSSICRDKDLSMLNLCLSELINNVYDHSHSLIGAYVFCQFYPKTKTIKLAVSDLGIGIPESVNTFLKTHKRDKKSHVECVKWAIKENKTTLSIPQNAGKGLDNVNCFIKAINSSWKLYTENVQLFGYPSGNRYLENNIHNFIGTLIEVSIKVDELEEKDDNLYQDELFW